MKLQRGLWMLVAALWIVEIVSFLVAMGNYEDDTRGGGSGFEEALAVFVVGGVALIVATVAAAGWTLARKLRRR